MDAPLAGLKVVELARILAGPWLGQTLADLGADVIKVEAPEGDDTRRWGPPFIERDHPNGEREKVAAYFQSTNRGKHSVICDFNNLDDLKKLKALISEADVLIENFKVGGLKKYGLDFETVHKLNPKLIYTSITGFGQDGPRADQPGYDFLIQGMCGIMDLTGTLDGEPQKIGVAWIDVLTGLYGTIAVQAALTDREKSGKGQQIDMSLLDCGVGALANQAANSLIGNLHPTRMGNAHPSIVPYQLFPTNDGHLIIACGNDRQFEALCKALEITDVATSINYQTNPARVENREALSVILTERTKLFSKADLIALLEKASVPVGPVNSVTEALGEQQIKHRNMKIDPEGIKSLRTPIQFSRSALNVEKAAPLLGTGKWQFGKDKS